MKIFIAIFLCSIFFFKNSLAQNLITSLKKSDVESLNNQLFKNFKKSTCYDANTEYKILNVYLINFPNHKDSLAKKYFLEHSNYRHSKNSRKRYILSYSYIYTNDSYLVAYTAYNTVYCINNYTEGVFNGEINVLRKFLELDCKYIYTIGMYDYYAIDQFGNFYYIEVDKNDDIKCTLLK